MFNKKILSTAMILSNLCCPVCFANNYEIVSPYSNDFEQKYESFKNMYNSASRYSDSLSNLAYNRLVVCFQRCLCLLTKNNTVHAGYIAKFSYNKDSVELSNIMTIFGLPYVKCYGSRLFTPLFDRYQELQEIRIFNGQSISSITGDLEAMGFVREQRGGEEFYILHRN